MGKDHEGQAKLTVWINREELEALDKHIREQNYISRAEWIRSRVRMALRGE